MLFLKSYENAVFIANSNENARSTMSEFTEFPSRILSEGAVEKVTEKAPKNAPRVALTNKMTRICVFRGEGFERSRYFLAFADKRVFITIYNEIFFCTYDFHSDFTEIPP